MCLLRVLDRPVAEDEEECPDLRPALWLGLWTAHSKSLTEVRGAAPTFMAEALGACPISSSWLGPWKVSVSGIRSNRLGVGETV